MNKHLGKNTVVGASVEKTLGIIHRLRQPRWGVDTTHLLVRHSHWQQTCEYRLLNPSGKSVVSDRFSQTLVVSVVHYRILVNPSHILYLFTIKFDHAR